MVRISENLGDGPHSLHTVSEPTDSHGSDPEQELWRQFDEATTPKSFCQSWLSLLCHIVKSIRSGMVLLGTPDRGPFSPAAIWPHPNFNIIHLTGAAEQALKERRGFLMKSDSAQSPEDVASESYHIAYPIEVAGKIYGVIVLEVGSRQKNEVRAIMRHLHWGVGWLEVMLRRNEALRSAEAIERLQAVLDLLTSALEHERYQQAATPEITILVGGGLDRVGIERLLSEKGEEK